MEGGQLGGDEWTRHGSFVNKPTRGWLHSDAVVSTTGVSYTVRVSDWHTLTTPLLTYIFTHMYFRSLSLHLYSLPFVFEETDTEMRKGQDCFLALA